LQRCRRHFQPFAIAPSSATTCALNVSISACPARTPEVATTEMIQPQRALASLLSILLGDDVFVSYARLDGKTYAQSLATSLPNLRVFIDLFGTEPGRRVPKSILRRLSKSTVCVLVATPSACESQSVAEEIRLFLTTKRPVIPISFGGALEVSPLNDALIGLPIASESLDARSPSAQVLAQIRAAVGDRSRLRQAQRVLRFALLSSLVATMIGLPLSYIKLISDRCSYRTEMVSRLRSYYDEEPRPNSQAAEQLDEAYAAESAACSMQPLPLLRKLGF
jgi:TIR domain